MPNALLDNFGLRLISRVRDSAITDWEMILNGRMKSDRAQSIYDSLSEEERQSVYSVTPAIVDSVLFHLLQWLDEEEWTDEKEKFRISGTVGDETTKSLAEDSDGFAGELFTKNGWIAIYSTQPHDQDE